MDVPLDVKVAVIAHGRTRLLSACNRENHLRLELLTLISDILPRPEPLFTLIEAHKLSVEILVKVASEISHHAAGINHILR